MKIFSQFYTMDDNCGLPTTLAGEAHAAVEMVDKVRNRFFEEFKTELSDIPADMPIAFKLSYLLGDTVRWNCVSHKATKPTITHDLYADLHDLLDEGDDY